MQSLLILGRQPALGLAELEGLYGPDKIRLVGDKVAVVDVDPCLLTFDRLGGSLKFCRILVTLETTNWKEIEKFLVKVSPGHSERMPEGKMQLGLSAIGMKVDVKQLGATALTLKKAVRKTGRNVRVIPNKSLELNTAQVLHNGLTKETGWELIFIRDGEKTIIAQTVKAQNIEAYARRDRERPKRDTRVGMLPPKLAQIIINLAAGKLPTEKLQNICDIPADQPVPRKLLGKTVLDPFCGTGVILQEALLMGYDVYGTDLEKRMIDYSTANLDWLKEIYNFDEKERLEAGDATNHQWQTCDFVASESYLGRPFTARPDAETLARTITDCNLIIKKFLRNIHGQIEPGTRLCLAIPAWLSSRSGPHASRSDEVQGGGEQRSKPFKSYGARVAQPTTQQFAKSARGVDGSAGKQSSAARYVWHLPLVDQIADLGYNRVSFEHIRDEDLIYYRPDQIVARQLLVIARK